MRKLGIVGGLGPAATAYFYEMITSLTDARRDQDHLEMLIYSKPQIPDRTAYILSKSNENPIPIIVDSANMLIGMGARHIAIPCVTAHSFYDEIARGVNAPVINVWLETAAHLKAQKIKQVGIMATDGLIKSGAFIAMLRANEIEVILPQPKDQAKVMQSIYNYKANCVKDTSSVIDITERMKDCGAEAILLACTELSLLKRDVRLDESYIDMMEILARRAIELSGLKCRESNNDN